MARGLPGVWSTLFSIPFVASGGYVYLGQTPYPAVLGVPLLAFAGFILAMGWYIHVVAAPPEPNFQQDEELLDTRYPTQKAAVTKVLFGIPCFIVSGYLLFGTLVPYLYPTVAFAAGLYLFSTGILTYWTNALTTYYVTSNRVISEFRLLSLVRKEVPVGKIRAVRESKSPIQALVNVGDIQVSSGGGASMIISITNIDSVTDFAEELRRLT